MGSFYGNSGLSVGEAEQKIEKSAEELKNHVIISKTQPTVQKEGDIWLVTVSSDDD